MKLSIKSFGKFSLLLTLLVSAMLLTGCGEAEKAEEKAAAPEKVVLKLAMDADPVSLDPHVQLSGGMLQYSNIVFDPLVRYAKDMSFEARLAERWERIDDTTMRFYLRKGVKFHSGNEFTAEDVVFTVDRLKKSTDFKGLFEPFVGAKVVDAHTVDLITKKPYGLVLNMATYVFPMDKAFYSGMDDQGKPKDAIVKTDYSFANMNQSGTGPFMVTQREQGVKMTLTRFADYWNTDGNVDEIILTPIKNDATRVAALLAGDVDFIMPVPPQDLDRIANTDGLQLATMPGSRIVMFQLNGERNPALADPKVRQAMAFAYDNVGVVEKIMKNFGTPGGQMSRSQPGPHPPFRSGKSQVSHGRVQLPRRFRGHHHRPEQPLRERREDRRGLRLHDGQDQHQAVPEDHAQSSVLG